MIRFALLALLLAAPTVHAQSWNDEPPSTSAEEAAWMEQQAAAMAAYHARIANTMAASEDVREQVFALILQPATRSQQGATPAGDAPSRAVPRDAAMDARLRSIAARAGDDRLANQLLILAVDDLASPIRSEAVRRWQAADPGNLAPLFHAGLSGDALLMQARQATHASTRLYDVVRWMVSAYQRHPLTAAELSALSGGETYHADEAAAFSAMGMWSAMTMSYRGLTEDCRGNALRATPTRAADCRHVATIMADHSDSTIDRMIGLSMLRELASSAERTAIDARRRVVDWQMMQWGRIAQQQPRDGAEQFVRLLRDDSIQSEQQLAERVLAEAGVPLQPPAGWSPPRY